MALDFLKNLVNNVPDWLQKLDDFSGQADRRQTELAAVAPAEGENAKTKSLRNKGSTESLKPKDHPPVVHAEPPTIEDILEDATPENKVQTPVNAEALKEYGSDTDTLVDSGEVPVLSDSPHKNFKLHDATENTANASEKIQVPELRTPDPSHIHNEINTATKRHLEGEYEGNEGREPKSASMMSNEDVPAACRPRKMITVYYDSYIVSFFVGLAKFASSSQNLLRKAKLAARIAWSKKLVEQDMSEGRNNDDALPLLRYMSSRRLSPTSISRPGANNRPPDVYDKLNKRLKFVQSMCEHGAYQFLRDGDCNDEISKVRKRLTEVLEMAKREMERVEREEPELAKERHDMIAGLEEDSPTTTKQDGKLEATDQMGTIEVDPKYADPNIMETDEGIYMEMEPPELQYRSTRVMRSRGP
ncbi:hypothetical protein FAGAP_932 [Fusarium agapanthi]|uniref:Uncharacterized protein n=1 Tax=Fusarium agapanthi TaxID=1803897 RepID=A0A9P5EI37_9HYPO|nr:hypothetical protein FAGAP_932 [Fusarium agapanthi]